APELCLCDYLRIFPRRDLSAQTRPGADIIIFIRYDWPWCFYADWSRERHRNRTPSNHLHCPGYNDGLLWRRDPRYSVQRHSRDFPTRNLCDNLYYWWNRLFYAAVFR